MRLVFIPRSGVASTPNIRGRGIAMANYTKEEAIEVLRVAKAKMDKATTKEEALAILKETGEEVSYTPTFRCLVMGHAPEDSIKWQ
jgi:hypothetical protein